MIVKVAVVDDEERIRQGLAKLVAMADESIQVAGTYASGQELLDALNTTDIDFIITDIKMPQMTGLQLIERVQQRRPKIRFAILSGFDDFSFARQAIRSGVEDFLLKPVDPVELRSLLLRVKQKLELERYRKAVAAEEHIRLLLGNEVRHLPDHMVQGASRELGQTDLFHEHFVVILLRSEPDLSTERTEQYVQSWMRPSRILVWETRHTVIVASIGQGDHADTARELGSMLLQRIPHSVKARIGISAVHQGPLKLREAFREAELALQQVWYDDDAKSVTDFPHLPKRTGDDSSSMMRTLDRDFRPALRVQDIERAETALRAWLEDAGRQRAGWLTLRDGCSAVFGWIRGEYSDKVNVSNEPIDEQLVLSPGRFLNWSAFTTAFMESASEQLHILKEARQENRVVETVKSYIQQHYTEELELQRLSDTVYLTPSYLSKLFKTETGETITDYIISVRIEHAKNHLVKEPSLKTYEVGERVGYPDPAYFNKVFKKVVGLTPKEFRDRVRQ